MGLRLFFFFFFLSHSSSPFCSDYFGDGALRTVYLGWPQTMILPITAYQEARIYRPEPPVLSFSQPFSVSALHFLSLAHSPSLTACFTFFGGFEVRVSCLLGRHSYSLSHSASPFFLWWIFFEILPTICPGMALDLDPPDLCLLSS
jgi:hypothetical protein